MSQQRPQLKEFADYMEQVLQANDHKGGWDRMNPLGLLDRAWDELRELDRIMFSSQAGTISFDQSQLDEVRRETADVASFCMMIFQRVADYGGIEMLSSNDNCFGCGFAHRPNYADCVCKKDID